MAYSSGIFPTPAASLREASVEKFDRVCRKLGLRPVGPGVGNRHGLGRLCDPRGEELRLPRDNDHDFAGTVQRSHSSESRKRGWPNRVTLLQQDYRDLRGQFDKLVSIEMIEAVGYRFLDRVSFASAANCCGQMARWCCRRLSCPNSGYRAVSQIGRLHSTLRLSRRMPAVARRDLGFHRPHDRPAIRACRGFRSALRRDIAALAASLPQATRRCAAAGVLGRVHPVMELLPLLLRSRVRGTPCRRAADSVRQARMPTRTCVYSRWLSCCRTWSCGNDLRPSSLALRALVRRQVKSLSPLILTLLANLIVIVFAMIALWIVSTIRRDASIVDPFWGLGFVVVAWVAWFNNSPPGPRIAILTSLTTIWGLRLSLFLMWRNLGHGEDRRYAAMRAHHGAGFWWVSLFTVFLLQGAILWFVSLPIQCAAALKSLVLLRLDRRSRGGYLEHRHVLRNRWRLATCTVQSRPQQCRACDGPRVVAVHSPSKLLWRLLRLVGHLPRSRRLEALGSRY